MARGPPVSANLICELLLVDTRPMEVAVPSSWKRYTVEPNTAKRSSSEPYASSPIVEQ